MATAEPTSRGVGARIVSTLFGLVFVTLGLGFSVVLARGFWQAARIYSWKPAECEILTSSVEERLEGKPAEAYRFTVAYRYAVDGRDYSASSYRQGYSGSASRAPAEGLAARFSSGSHHTCFVDPQDPAAAFLARPSLWPALVFLVPLLFIGFGAVSIALAWRPAPAGLAGGRRGAAPDWPPAPQAQPGPERDSLVLHPRQTPIGTLAGMILFAIVWDGVVSVFVVVLVNGWQTGDHAWGMALFLVPFVAIGLLAPFGVVYSLLALWNPRPHLTLTPARLRPGDTAQLAWRFSGAPSRIGRLRITLEGREEATHAAGKSSTTERSTFLVLPLVDATEPTAIPAGTASLAVSARTMHSFAGRRNRIVWSLKVAGEIRRWPDVDDEFEVAVLPAAVASGWAG